MTRYAALLRSVNVGGRGKLAMSDLRDLAACLGFTDALTLLQTGNLVFSSSLRTDAELERVLEEAAANRLSFSTKAFVRDAATWFEIIGENPFAGEAIADPSHLVLMLFKEQPSAQQQDDLRAAIVGRERIAFAGRHAYIVYPDGIGRSKLTHGLVESKLVTLATGRNWNTVVKVAGALGSST